MPQVNPHTSNVLVMSNGKNTPQSNFDTSENVAMITTDLHTSHDVSMATSSSDTSHVQVKVEKPDSPLPPQIQTCQISSTEMSIKSPGNRFYDHSEDIAKRKRTQLGDRPQCSVCMKTFSRSGTLRVLYNLVSYPPLFLALTELRCSIPRAYKIVRNQPDPDNGVRCEVRGWKKEERGRVRGGDP